MLAKLWKKIGIIILIVACLFNIISKLVKIVPATKQIESTATDYVQTITNPKK